MLPCQCGNPESSCQHERATKSDIIQQPGLALVLPRFYIYQDFFPICSESWCMVLWTKAHGAISIMSCVSSRRGEEYVQVPRNPHLWKTVTRPLECLNSSWAAHTACGVVVLVKAWVTCRPLQHCSHKALPEQHYASDSPRDVKMPQALGSWLSSWQFLRFMKIILAEKV